MGTLHRPTDPIPKPAVQSQRGVYEADPFNPPTPKPGSRAVAIKDDAGEIVTWAMVDPAYIGEELDAQAWTWLEICEMIARQRRITPLKLVP